MAVMAAFVGSGREEVTRQLTPLGIVEWCDSADALVERAVAGDVDAVVTGFDDEADRSIAPAIVALAARRPSLPVIVYERINGATLHKLLAVFATGVRMTCAVRPHEHLEPVLRYVSSPSFFPSVTPVLLQHFVRHAPAGLAVFVALAALVAPSRRGVAEVAAWARASPRTIDRRLLRARWPTAHTILQSFVALDAVWLMTEYGWPARHVQEVRGFSHPSAVTRLLARYCGVHPGTLHEDGGFAAALEHVTRVLSVGEAL
jgi:hypothetical protein